MMETETDLIVSCDCSGSRFHRIEAAIYKANARISLPRATDGGNNVVGAYRLISRR